MIMKFWVYFIIFGFLYSEKNNNFKGWFFFEVFCNKIIIGCLIYFFFCGDFFVSFSMKF